MSEHIICPADSVGEGEHVIVELKGREITIYNIGDEYVAYPNWCPHQGGPLCEGEVGGTTDACFDRESLESTIQWVKEGEIVICPWHGWEFDLRENRFLHDDDVTLPSYAVHIEDGDLIVSV